jgi:rare lipoprotein A
MTLLKKKSYILICFFILFSNLLFSQDSIYQTGLASYYSDAFQGRHTSTGEKYCSNLYTAAHATLPLNTMVKVTNLKNNKSVIVKINDRCAYYHTRIIDLSKAAAKKLDILTSGVGKVTVEIIKPSDLLIIDNIKDFMLQPAKKDTTGNIGKFDINKFVMQYLQKNQIMQPASFSRSLFLTAYANNLYSTKEEHFINKMICTYFPAFSVFGFMA